MLYLLRKLRNAFQYNNRYITPADARLLAHQRQLDLIALFIAVISALANDFPTYFDPSQTSYHHCQRVLVLCLEVLTLLCVWKLSPANYARWRTLLIAGLRLSLPMLPIVRDPEFFAARLNIIPNNSSYRAALVTEPFIIAIGSGVFTLFNFGFLLPLPLGHNLLVQCLNLLCFRNNLVLCSSKLLYNGIYKERIRKFSSVMAMVFSYPGTEVVGTMATQMEECRAAMTFFKITVGLLLPNLLLLWIVPPIL